MSQGRLNRINARITELDAEIASLDAAVAGCTGVQNCIDVRKTKLNDEKSSLTKRKTAMEAKLALDFSEAQQTIVDGINTLFNNKYSSQFEDLKRKPEEDKTAFFDLYAEADTDFLRELIIKETFNL